jgi:hypothetical protein
MEPLDLRKRAPRGPRERLGGLTALPRTIDKARATLPGGNLGVYFISPGISAFVLGKLEVSESEFLAIVAAAHDDDEIAARVLTDIDPARIARWSAALEGLTVEQVDPQTRPVFDDLYGPQRPSDTVLDVIAQDDAKLFPSA